MQHWGLEPRILVGSWSVLVVFRIPVPTHSLNLFNTISLNQYIQNNRMAVENDRLQFGPWKNMSNPQGVSTQQDHGHTIRPWRRQRTTSSTPFGRTCPPRKVRGWWRRCWPHLRNSWGIYHKNHHCLVLQSPCSVQNKASHHVGRYTVKVLSTMRGSYCFRLLILSAHLVKFLVCCSF